ncbi:hypothetical protein EUX98_g9165 [Antrodiella citrinella]|uniref:Fe2OG dioxygenase domain-containing protein n=1 Tax=Antrodiella citrinella TaxID=2447956 RepID=A0A4S4LXA3_9APHY|nr:hypothetical protein EUX98_g9165 [Antrodiella citrinella]
MPGLTTFPSFPNDVPTHPLLIVDYQLLLQRDEDEVNKLWKAATQLGFWYLKNHGVDEEVNGMFEMGAETMALPLEEKMKFEQGDSGMSAGYKAAGLVATDATGDKDTAEFINISKDDALAWPGHVHRTYPSTVNARMESTIVPFVRKSLEVNANIMGIFNDKLGLPEGTLAKFHTLEVPSGSEARCIKNPPKPEQPPALPKVAIGSHTDFGSLSFLHNRLGGLQVLPPDYTEWQYVKPIPRHAICNIGDSLAIFSGGILRSNLHRVLPPPREQSKYERWSLVFFTRPGNTYELRALTDESPQIADAVANAPNPESYNPGATAGNWFARRIKNQRLNNRTKDMQPESFDTRLETASGPKPYIDVWKLRGRKEGIDYGSGIGRAVAILFVREGVDVTIVHLSEEQKDADDTVPTILHEGRQGLSIALNLEDFRNADQVVKKHVDTIGKIDILVNNASKQTTEKDFANIDLDVIESSFKNNI